MEIKGTDLADLKTGVQRLEALPQAERPDKSGGGNVNPDSDRIEFSVRGREISQLDELIRSTPDIREAKVEQVRIAIQNGTYDIKAELIADKILGGKLLDEVF